MASSNKFVLQTATALTAATTNGTSQNIPAKARKLLGHINVSACDPATTVTGKIQHSPDQANWYDYISFTAIVGAAGAEGKGPSSSDAPCFQYLRATVTLAGATKSATVAIDLWFET